MIVFSFIFFLLSLSLPQDQLELSLVCIIQYFPMFLLGLILNLLVDLFDSFIFLFIFLFHLLLLIHQIDSFCLYFLNPLGILLSLSGESNILGLQIKIHFGSVISAFIFDFDFFLIQYHFSFLLSQIHFDFPDLLSGGFYLTITFIFRGAFLKSREFFF